ncbi:hypothetical protein BH18CHL2_BH18CHL2_05960 [soil metagenome]
MTPEDLFPAPSVAREIDRELFLLLGGPAALLMQVAHPLVAAAVADHSSFREDPFGRLHRTLNTTLAVVFAYPAGARRALRRIDGRHGTVEGVASDGRGYRARDPRLLLWVQSTLVLTSLRPYELVIGPLAADRRNSYWDETKPIARALGVPPSLVPGTIAALERFEREMLASEVRPDVTSRAVARSVLRPVPWAPGALHGPIDVLAAGLLPAELRAALGLRWRRRERVLFRAMIAAVRVARRVLPRGLAAVPQARRFERRRAR